MSKFKTGDIFFTDSDKTQARIVKFLMQSPTFWHWLIGIRDEVRFYHVGMVLNDKEVIEQQGKGVRITSIENAFINKPHVVWRYTHLTQGQRTLLMINAVADLKAKADYWLILGKTLTWLTGIKWFTRVIQARGKEICVTRTGKWYYNVCGNKIFGDKCKTHHELTTDIMDNYFLKYTYLWKVISYK